MSTEKNKKVFWKYIWIPIALYAVLLIYTYYRESSMNKQSDKNVIKIGAILPLTGDAALAGINTKLGIELAIESLSRHGVLGKDSLSVIYEDTKGESKVGITVVQKLIEVDKVSYIIDNSISDVTLAVSPIVEKNKVVLISTGGSSPLISNAGKNIFRIWNSDIEESAVMATYVNDTLKPQNILILNVNNEYGTGLKNSFEKLLDKNVLLKSINFENNESNFNKLLIDASNFQYIYIISYSNQAIQILNKLKEINFKGKILGTSVMLDPNVINTATKLNFDIYYPVPLMPDSLNTLFKNFTIDYKSKYNSSPAPLADVGFDAVMLLAEVIKLKDENKDLYENIIQNFNKDNVFYGASGIIQFDKNGDVHKPILINKIKYK